MIRLLFSLYRHSPYGARRVLSRAAAPVRLLLKPFINKIACRGFIQHLDFSDNASFKYFSDRGRYEGLLVDTFLRAISLNPGSYVVDIGGHYGTYSLSAADIGRYGLVSKIFVFEPDRRPFEALSRSIQDNQFTDLIEPWNVLCGENSGTALLLKSERSSASNRSFHSTEHSLRFAASVETPCVRIDDIISRNISVATSTFIIKIDIEGSEIRALRGAHRILTKSKGFYLQYEYQPVAIREVGLSPEEFRQFIIGLNPEFAYIATAEGLRPLDGLDQLDKAMAELDWRPDALSGTAAENFVVGRGVRDPVIAKGL